MKNADLILKNFIILTQDPQGSIHYCGSAAVAGGKIAAVGDAEEIARQWKGAEVIDGRGRKALLPGFVNTHFHATQNFMKGTRDDYDLLDWIDKVSFPRIKVTIKEYRQGLAELHQLAVMHAGIDLLSSGVTCSANMEWGMRPAIQQAYERVGARFINILTMTDVDSWTPAEAIIGEDELFSLAHELNDACSGTRTRFAYGIACPNSASEKLLRRTVREAEADGIPLHIHLAETKFEYDRFLMEQGMSPTAYLEKLGFWEPEGWAAHCIWLDDEDIDILARHGVGVAHNPKCNMKIADGAAPIAAMRAKGVKVSLGIDSCAVSDNTDFFETMRTMVFLQRLKTMDPKAILGRDALSIATIGGAEVLGMEDLIGSIEPGKAADLLVVDLNGVRTRPYNDLVNNLVFAANSAQIERVIVGGETLVHEGRFTRFDAQALLDEIEQRAAAIYRAAGIDLPPYFAVNAARGCETDT